MKKLLLFIGALIALFYVGSFVTDTQELSEKKVVIRSVGSETCYIDDDGSVSWTYHLGSLAGDCIKVHYRVSAIPGDNIDSTGIELFHTSTTAEQISLALDKKADQLITLYEQKKAREMEVQRKTEEVRDRLSK